MSEADMSEADLSEQGVVTLGSPEASAFLGVVKSAEDFAGTGADFRGEAAEPASESLSGSTAHRILAAALAREHLGAGVS
jgi:hypothetical protein